jgi:two-component system, NarL family, response regulator LiaR
MPEHKPARKLRVIVADDDPLARRLVRDALQLAGIIVVADAADGREAVELARYYRPDVVLMDVVMPGVDGLKATEQITREVPETRVVMLTGTNEDDLGLLGLKAGAVGFISKDVPVEAVARAVRGVHAGEAAFSRLLSRRIVNELQSLPRGGIGVRPVRSPLTPREWEVLDLLCQDKDTREIAATLFLSLETVRSHIKNILRKLGVRSRREAVALAASLREPAGS